MDLVGWLVTPALVATLLIATVPLYNPTVRWSRRLRNDIQIANGLPDGPEKQLLSVDVETQARRLRLYREAFRGRHLVGKWGFVAYFTGALSAFFFARPDSTSGTLNHYLVIGGALVGIMYLILIGCGLDILGRPPAAIIRADRVRRYRARRRKLARLNKARIAAIAEGRSLQPHSSDLGFRSQVDPLGDWVRTWEMRSIARFTGIAGGGLSADAVKSLRAKGLKVPNPYR